MKIPTLFMESLPKWIMYTGADPGGWGIGGTCPPSGLRKCDTRRFAVCLAYVATPMRYTFL